MSREEKFQQLPEWVKSEFNKNPEINATVKTWLETDTPVIELMSDLGSAITQQLNATRERLDDVVDRMINPPLVKRPLTDAQAMILIYSVRYALAGKRKNAARVVVADVKWNWMNLGRAYRAKIKKIIRGKLEARPMLSAFGWDDVLMYED